MPDKIYNREKRRQKGQFWTPDWLADALIAYLVAHGAQTLFDPAVGAGAFFRAVKRHNAKNQSAIQFLGTEIDPTALDEGQSLGLSVADIRHIEIRDFALDPPDLRFEAIVANPPFIRHHRISAEAKQQLHRYSQQRLGVSLDGRVGLHVFFLLRGLDLLSEGGRLAYIMPADTCEGVFAKPLWQWITRHYRLRGVITFSHAASPFQEVDINPLIFLIEKQKPQPSFDWIIVHTTNENVLQQWFASDLQTPLPTPEIERFDRPLTEALNTGLSRHPKLHTSSTVYTLGDFAKVMRGIATGDNDFFFLTHSKADLLDIPADFLIPAVARTRDVPEDIIDEALMEFLKNKGRPTMLLSLDSRTVDQFPLAVQHYLKLGEANGLPQKPLISTRRPWYKMEKRAIPPFLFAYLGRRNTRFIRNVAGVVPLNGFLGLYPHVLDTDSVERLWNILSHPQTVENLKQVGKSYGGGAVKVEPRALESLPLPTDIVEEFQLMPLQVEQPRLL